MKKLLAGLLFAASMASGPAFAEVDAATARGVMQESGLWDSLSEVPVALRGGVQAGLANAGGALPADASQRLLQAAEAAFTPQRAQSVALEVVRNGLDAPTVAELRKWNATALGQKLLELEKASATSADQATRVADAQAALQAADEPRRKVLADIVASTNAVETMAEISVGSAMTLLRGISAANPGTPGLPSEEVLRAMIQGQLAAAKPQMQAALTANVALTYAGVSTAELQTYEAHLRSPAGARLNALTLSALGAVMQDAAIEIGRRLAAPKAPANP